VCSRGCLGLERLSAVRIKARRRRHVVAIEAAADAPRRMPHQARAQTRWCRPVPLALSRQPGINERMGEAVRGPDVSPRLTDH
jgi:hypothetical protein